MATVSKGRTFVSGETVTPAKLNELVDNATVTAIQTADIADGQITTAKIADANVTTAKIADSAVTTAKIANASITPSKLSQPYTLATSVASTSGTNIDFTGIPSWAKRITVMFDGVSTNGTSVIIFQLSTGGVFVTTGYSGSAISFNTTTAAGDNYTNVNGIRTRGTNAAANSWNGQLTLMTMGSNRWITSGNFETTDGSGAGSVGITFSHVLSGALDGVRVTTVNGTDTFDAGVINIAYEG